MEVKSKLEVLMLMVIFCLTCISQNSNTLVSAEELNEIRITGLVERPRNFTYTDLFSFPMVSEVATLSCPFDGWEVTFNWTGIPLFYLLTSAGVTEEGASVNFRGRDGYTSNIRIAEVLKPTAILAVKGNGSDLSEMTGREGGLRVVFPCKEGYNWVTDIVEIEVIDKVLTEVDQDRENCVLPSFDPPLQLFNLTLGKREFEIEVFANVSINGFNFDYEQEQFRFNTTGPAGTTGFTELVMPQNLLEGPHLVFLDEEPVEFIEANVANLTFIYLSFPEASHTIKIVGTRVLTVTVERQSGDTSVTILGSAAIISVSVLVLTILLLRRRPELPMRLLNRLRTIRDISRATEDLSQIQIQRPTQNCNRSP